MVLCQNEADVKCQMDIDSQISLTEQAVWFSLLVLWLRFGGNFHWELYFCLILAEGSANCSFQYLRQAISVISSKHCLCLQLGLRPTSPVRLKNPDYLGLKTQTLPDNSLKNVRWVAIMLIYVNIFSGASEVGVSNKPPWLWTATRHKLPKFEKKTARLTKSSPGQLY